MTSAKALECGRLRGLLLASTSPQAARALAAVDNAAQHAWTVGRQTAATWAPTLVLKYELARERGVDVRGLDELVDVLSAQDGEVAGVALVHGAALLLVVLNKELTAVLGILSASPKGSA